MTKIKFFQGLLNSLFDKPKINKSFNFLFEKKKSLTTSEYVENVVSAKGEVSALSHAELLISHCERLNDKELINFFEKVLIEELLSDKPSILKAPSLVIFNSCNSASSGNISARLNIKFE